MGCLVYSYGPARKSLLVLDYSTEGCLANAGWQRLYFHGRNGAKGNKSRVASSLARDIENLLQDLRIEPSVEEDGITSLQGKYKTREQLLRISKCLRRYFGSRANDRL
jgi:hypothetical protein